MFNPIKPPNFVNATRAPSLCLSLSPLLCLASTQGVCVCVCVRELGASCALHLCCQMATRLLIAMATWVANTITRSMHQRYTHTHTHSLAGRQRDLEQAHTLINALAVQLFDRFQRCLASNATCTVFSSYLS